MECSRLTNWASLWFVSPYEMTNPEKKIVFFSFFVLKLMLALFIMTAPHCRASKSNTINDWIDCWRFGYSLIIQPQIWETSTGHSPAACTSPEGAGSQTTPLRLHCLGFFLDIFLFVLVMIMSLKTVNGTVVVFNKCEPNTQTQVNTHKAPAAAAWHNRKKTWRHL